MTKNDLIKVRVSLLEYARHTGFEATEYLRIIDEELAAEPQQPVAYRQKVQFYATEIWCYSEERRTGYNEPLYTRGMRDLSNEEIKDIELSLREYCDNDRYDLSLNKFARAIIAAAKESK